MKIRINKKIIGGVLLSLLIVLIFFSKTIYSYNLPEVTAVKPYNGKLSNVEVGYGMVQWAVIDSIYIPEEGTVGEIYAHEGEYVEAGQPLFSMEYDMDENEWKLQEIENDRKRLQSEMQKIENQIAMTAHTDAEIIDVQQSLAEAENYLAAAELFYEYGDISTQELNEARNQVNYLRAKLNNLVLEAAENAKSLQLGLEEKKLELEALAISEERYRKVQSVHNTDIMITAPAEGMVISSNISAGEKVQKDLLAATIGVGNEYYLECSVSLENNFISTGDTCSLSNPSHQAKGTISSILPTNQQKTIRIRFTAEGVTAGETFEVLFQKQSETNYILIPSTAVCQDSSGYYLKQVKRRDGIMGKEYYLERIDIYIGDSDSTNTVIVQGVTFFEPVVLSSDKAAVVGDVVTLKNAGDFFEE